MNATATPTKKDTHVGALIFSIDMQLTPKSKALLDYLKSLETDATPPVATEPPNATAELIARKHGGKTGTITRREEGGGYWDVTFKGRGGGVAMFAEDQMEAVQA